jgi:hypothetical protein
VLILKKSTCSVSPFAEGKFKWADVPVKVLILKKINMQRQPLCRRQI